MRGSYGDLAAKTGAEATPRCEEQIHAGLGRKIFPRLERTEAVRKAAFAARGERPGVQDHLGSMSVTSSLVPSGIMVVVDDFVTKGATTLAAASLVKAAFPQREIAAFALVRTMGLVPEVDRIPAPCTGRIWLSSGGVVRREP